jgi:hypothetical protein
VGAESVRDLEFAEVSRWLREPRHNNAKSCAVDSSCGQGSKHDALDEFDRRFRTFLTLPFVLGHLRRQIVRWLWNSLSAQSTTDR